MKTMYAFEFTCYGERDKPMFSTSWHLAEPQSGETLVLVDACSLNHSDVNTRAAWYPKRRSKNTPGAVFDEVEQEDAIWAGAAISFPGNNGVDVSGSVTALIDGADQSQ